MQFSCLAGCSLSQWEARAWAAFRRARTPELKLLILKNVPPSFMKSGRRTIYIFFWSGHYKWKLAESLRRNIFAPVEMNVKLLMLVGNIHTFLMDRIVKTVKPELYSTFRQHIHASFSRSTFSQINEIRFSQIYNFSWKWCNTCKGLVQIEPLYHSQQRRSAYKILLTAK